MYKNIHPFPWWKTCFCNFTKKEDLLQRTVWKGFQSKVSSDWKGFGKIFRILGSWWRPCWVLFFSNVFMMSLPGAYSFSNRCNVNKRNYTKEIITLCVWRQHYYSSKLSGDNYVSYILIKSKHARWNTSFCCKQRILVSDTETKFTLN